MLSADGYPDMRFWNATDTDGYEILGTDGYGYNNSIYAVAHYLDPRFKDQFVPNRLEFVSKIHSWIKSDILLPTNSGEILIDVANIDEERPPSPKKKCDDFFASRANKFVARKTPTKGSSQPAEDIEFELNLYRKADLEPLDNRTAYSDHIALKPTSSARLYRNCGPKFAPIMSPTKYTVAQG
uniref:Peptidase_M14 domain-containing protein n=1 Tax=Globodera pallida TaxID=36090 RepID=A0A183BUP4_GLOPA